MVTNPSVCPFGGSGAVCSISVHVLFEYCHTHYLSLESEKRKKERTLLTAAGGSRDRECRCIENKKTSVLYGWIEAFGYLPRSEL